MKTQSFSNTILIIDDEIFYQGAELMAYLNVHFFDIELITAETLVEAKEIVKSNKIDLILLDLLFPSGDKNFISDEHYNGLLFLKFLKDDTTLKDIPVICMSAANEKNVTSAIEALNSFLIIKPFKYYELISMLEKILR